MTDMRSKFEAWRTDALRHSGSISVTPLEAYEAGIAVGAASQGEQEPVAITVTQFRGNTMTWLIEPALPVGMKLYAAPLPQGEQADKLREIIACAYQIAGYHDADAHILDVFANPDEATQEQIDAILPYHPQGEQCPSEVNAIPLHGGKALVRHAKTAWNLIDSSGEHIRFLNFFEQEFLNSALKAAQPKDAQ